MRVSEEFDDATIGEKLGESCDGEGRCSRSGPLGCPRRSVPYRREALDGRCRTDGRSSMVGAEPLGGPRWSVPYRRGVLDGRCHTDGRSSMVGAIPMGGPRWSVPNRREVLDGRCHTDGRDGGADRAGAASALLQRHIRAVTGAALLTSRIWLLIRGCCCQTEGGAGKSGRRCRCRPLRLSCIIASPRCPSKVVLSLPRRPPVSVPAAGRSSMVGAIPTGGPRWSVPYRRARRRSRSRGRGEHAIAAAHSDSDWRGAPDKSAVAVDPRLLVPNRRGAPARVAAAVGAGRWEVRGGRCHTDGRDGGADRAGAASALLQRHIRAASVAALLTSRLWLLIRGCWCQTEGGAGKSGRHCRCQPLRLSCIIA